MIREQWEQVVQQIEPGAKLLGTRALQGGVSAQVTKLDVEMPDGAVRKLLARRHGEADRSRNPQIAQHEFMLLQRLKAAGLPVPAPYIALDRFGGAPLLVTEFMEGEVLGSMENVPDAMLQLADRLSDIHQVAWERHALHFLPKLNDGCDAKLNKRPERMDDSLSEGRIRDALEAVWPLPQANRDVLLHGDFWPGNVIWKDGRIASLIDWEDAAIGDPLFDLANARLELLWASGTDAMDGFTQRYQTRNPGLDYSALPVWDLIAALKPATGLSEWGLPPDIERQMREKHRLFTEHALARMQR
ncbi:MULTISPECIES: phosphotransferase family protein [Paenibacillus]|uniref:Tyrosine protein kinase:aminoglycoside phosphotransferase n=1 Tax=Paenibacillus albilobatus TaxID=2716884 RepID=A0A920CAJ6_9BACL|nr:MULTISPECIES: phosphotransferase [Paenibacillus]GIO30973.1 tyrosine protein kinase:aminoglycoside phosphotransferase [Paenibacillus albilobatus]